MNDTLQKLGVLAVSLVAIIFASSYINGLTGNVASVKVNEFSATQAAAGIVLEKDAHNFFSCASGNTPINSSALHGARVWMYGFTGSEPPFSGPFFVSQGEAAANPQNASLNTLSTLTAGREYYSMGDTDLNFKCGVGISTVAECGDNVCNGSETLASCAQDCSVCGDNQCTGSETLASCAEDCSVCGDNQCSGNENVTSCAQDCSLCGDKQCTGNESIATCPGDCSVCGDNQCTGDENTSTCAADCSVCGDKILGSDACDDGNTDSGDGCSAQCTIEASYNCTFTQGLGSTCTRIIPTMTPGGPNFPFPVPPTTPTPPSNPTPTPPTAACTHTRGDINGDGNITSQDALLVINHVNKTTNLTGMLRICADLDGDGDVDGSDASTAVTIVQSGGPSTKPAAPTCTHGRGDINGDGNLTSQDALLVIGHVNNTTNLTGVRLACADLDGDGDVDGIDASEAVRIVQNGGPVTPPTPPAPPTTPTPPPSTPPVTCTHARGDINGDGKLTNADPKLVFDHVNRISNLTGVELKCADLDFDGDVDANDAASALQLVVLGETSPVCVQPPGDINGDGNVTSQDALLVIKHVNGSLQLSGMMLLCADFDKDGDVDNADATEAIRMVQNGGQATKPAAPQVTCTHTRGDINGDGNLTSQDALLVIGHVNKTTSLTGVQLACADLDGNGQVNDTDAAEAVKIVQKKASSPPSTTPPNKSEPPAKPEPEPQCTDSDGGAEFMTHGVATDNHQSIPDVCTNPNTLRESVCQGTVATSVVKHCGTGCEEVNGQARCKTITSPDPVIALHSITVGTDDPRIGEMVEITYSKNFTDRVQLYTHFGGYNQRIPLFTKQGDMVIEKINNALLGTPIAPGQELKLCRLSISGAPISCSSYVKVTSKVTPPVSDPPENEASVTLHSATIIKKNSHGTDYPALKVLYSKNDNTCYHIKKKWQNSFNMGINFICNNGQFQSNDAFLPPAPSGQKNRTIGESLKEGDEIKICRGNGAMLCSDYVRIEALPDGSGGSNNGKTQTNDTGVSSITNGSTDADGTPIPEGRFHNIGTFTFTPVPGKEANIRRLIFSVDADNVMLSSTFTLRIGVNSVGTCTTLYKPTRFNPDGAPYPANSQFISNQFLVDCTGSIRVRNGQPTTVKLNTYVEDAQMDNRFSVLQVKLKNLNSLGATIGGGGSHIEIQNNVGKRFSGIPGSPAEVASTRYAR